MTPFDKSLQPRARDLSPEEVQARLDHCLALDSAVRAALRSGKAALWQTAKALYEFESEAAYLALGYDTLNEWLADPEIATTRTTYFRLVGAYRDLVVRRQIPAAIVEQLDISKVEVVMPKVESGEVRLDDALADVKALVKRDLREKYVTPSANGGTNKLMAPGANGCASEPDDLDEPGDLSLEQALEDWEALDECLLDALASGSPDPRIPRDVLAAGYKGIHRLLEEAAGIELLTEEEAAL